MNKTILFFFVFGIHFILHGQRIIETDSTLALPFEQINLSTDKDIYLSGETIWFTANISLENSKEAMSKVIYIELFNKNKSLIIKRKFNVIDDLVQGTIDIPNEFLSEVYYLRAYTLYNKNFPVERFYVSALQIINPKKGIPFKEESEQVNLLANSKPISHLIEIKMPKNGMQFVSISKTNFSSENLETLSLELQNKLMETISLAHFSLNTTKLTVAFPDTSFLNQGLHYYVLKDDRQNVLNVKAFVYSTEENQAKAEQAKQLVRKKRESVSIKLDSLELKQAKTLGIKVVLKGNILSPIEKINFFKRDPYLLTNYIKTQFNPLLLNAQDLSLSLEIINKELENESYKSIFYNPYIFTVNWIPELRDIGLSGFVLNKSSQQPVAQVPVLLSIFKDRPQNHLAISNNDGSFHFAFNNAEMPSDVLLCPLVENPEEFELKVSRKFSLDFPNYQEIPLSIDSSDIGLIEQMLVASHFSNKNKTLPTVQNFKINYFPYSFDDPDIFIRLDDYIDMETLALAFKEFVPSVRIRKRNDDYRLSVFDMIAEKTYRHPLILVDDVPVFDHNEVLKISPKVIESIGVHYTPFDMGSNAIKGIISIKTNTDNFGGITPKSSTFFQFQTMSPAYSFYSKNYADPKVFASRSADFRNLLFWNSNLNQKELNNLQFYTSDQVGMYEAYLFGIDNKGQSINKKLFKLEVKD